MSKLVAILVLSLGASSAAFAGNSNCGLLGELLGICGNPGHGGNPTQAPEIDPASAMSGLSLLVGGLAVMRGRRKKQP
jgi:hypothetical protein